MCKIRHNNTRDCENPVIDIIENRLPERNELDCRSSKIYCLIRSGHLLFIFISESANREIDLIGPFRAKTLLSHHRIVLIVVRRNVLMIINVRMSTSGSGGAVTCFIVCLAQ